MSGILRALAYLEPCLFRHIQAHSIIRDVITLNFFHFNLHTFQPKLKRHMFFDYNDVNFNFRLSLFK